MTTPKPTATGASAWAAGLLVLLPIPLLGPLAAGGAMVAVYGSLSRQGALARANARNARTWGRFFLIVPTALLAVQVALIVPRLEHPSTGAGPLPLGVPLLLYLLVCVVHLVVVTIGTIRARRGEVARVPFLPGSS